MTPALIEAKLQGLTRYQGKPCPHGHIGIRMVNSHHCYHCLRERKRGWAIRNTARLNEIANLSRARRKARDPATFNVLKRLDKMRRRNVPGSYTNEDLHTILENQGLSCYCGVSFLIVTPTVDHVIPVSRGGSNWPSNIQLLCGPCNSSKCDKTMEEWLCEETTAIH